MDNKTYFVDQLSDIIVEYSELKRKSKFGDFSDFQNEISGLITKSKATVGRIGGSNSEYYKELLRNLEKTGYDGAKLPFIIGVVTALKEELEKGYLKNLGEIIRSEVFTDYLEMAEYLLGEGYKDPATVIAGSTLESHLKKLCLKNTIGITVDRDGKPKPKKAEVMNSELSKQNVYTSSNQKQITAWLSIRNDAAHGHYGEYNKEQVDLMIKGINDFIAAYPA